MTAPIPRRAAAALLLVAASAARAQDEGPAVTIYSSADPAGFDPQQFIAQQRQGYNPYFAWQVPGFAVVKETRTAKLEQGLTTLRFTDVAQFIDPTTVSIVDLTDAAGTSVLEQNFEFDLVSPSKLLEKYVDRTIGYEITKDGALVKRLDGRLLSANQGQLVLETPEGLRFLSASDPGIRLPSLPEGLITKPTLVWKLNAATAGDHKVRTTYQTSGMTWRADYNLVLSGDDTKADVGAWVTLVNLCGASFKNARLKLIAGDVQRIQPPRPYGVGGGGLARKAAAEAGFQEKAFFEYHLYTLPRRTDVLENATQQITLFPTARDVAVEKVLVYYGLPDAANWGFFPNPQMDRGFGTQSNPKVDVYLRFRNSQDNHMGMPLPKGKVRAYKQDDADGTLEFVGEDLIDHTPKDENVLVKLGKAFDVVGERVQTDFKIDTAHDWMTDSYRITLRNHKDQPVKVIVKENLYRWNQWEILENSDPFTKVDARTIHFEVVVPANGEKTVTYTARYTW